MFRLKTLAGLGALALGTTASFGAFAQEAAAAEDVLNSGDTAWMLVSTLLVLMMTIPGVALFYGGMVRKKNVLATMMQSFAITCLVSILWYAVGYSLAFGEGGPYVGDLSKLFLAGLTPDALSGTFPESVFIVFQMTFGIITAALITGSVADRMKFSSLLVFITAWLILIYAPICHWVWGDGFLSEMGVLDFAGGTVVHINAGIAGLVAALVLGKRTGYGSENMSPHNLTLSVIGAALLWVGWFGFNAGSAVAADGAAGYAMLVTQIATAAAALAWMVIEWAARGKASVLGIISGAIAGLVAITPAAGFVGPGGAILIGLASGVVCYIFSTAVKKALGYDDSLDCFGIHGIGGIVGALLTGVFAVEAIGGTAGLLEGNGAQLWLQFVGVGVTIVYVAVVTFIILKVIDLVMGLRVTTDEEREGLDQALHGESVH
ncbi:MAG: ammonium transporter [Alphaproteobacteria bacterium]